MVDFFKKDAIRSTNVEAASDQGHISIAETNRKASQYENASKEDRAYSQVKVFLIYSIPATLLLATCYYTYLFIYHKEILEQTLMIESAASVILNASIGAVFGALIDRQFFRRGEKK